MYYLDKINMLEKRTDLAVHFDFSIFFATSKIILAVVLVILKSKIK